MRVCVIKCSLHPTLLSVCRQSGNLDHIPVTCVDAFPALKEFEARVSKHLADAGVATGFEK